jgi:ubiquinone/menaquinone biosynthesis C-methylase UbiE
MDLSREENPFEDKIIAKQWIAAVESDVGGSREEIIYPKISNWVLDKKYQTVLDIGAGQGICASHVKAPHYIGIDPSITLIERAVQKYSREGKEFRVGNVYETNLASSSIDGAFAIGVWFHLEDLDRAHSEMSRVIRPDGGLLIFTSNPETHDLWLASFYESIREGNKVTGVSYLPTGKLDKDIFYLHSKEDIEESLRRNSFEIIKAETFGEEASIGLHGGIWLAIEAVRSYNPKF